MKTYEERMASVEQKLQRKKNNRRILAVTAGALCLCIVAGIFFIPYDNTSRYDSSEYFKVIQAIERDFPNYNDNRLYLDEWEEKDDLIFEAGPPAAAPGDMAPDVNNSNNSSVEITDHQVAGVLEADVIKRSQTHIFYLENCLLKVYPIAGEDTQLLSSWMLPLHKDAYYYGNAQMYLSADATRINLVISGSGKVFDPQRWDAFVQLVSLDVSDPENIKEEKNIYISGSLNTVRMVGEQMMVVSYYHPEDKIDFDKPETFLPHLGAGENMQIVPADQIVVPEKLNNLAYTVVTMVDSKTMEVIDSGAFMSYANQIYVSKERIYATRSYGEEVFVEKTANKEIWAHKSMTEISCMTYHAEGLELAGTFKVEGTVRNQYYMDEYEGIFRVVTETNCLEEQRRENGTVEVFRNQKRNANLYCFEVGTWEQKAVVERFAPDGETVESVRFDGNYAYVCTAVVVTLTDPVFFFDLTDLDNIIVKDTGVIEGYSSSLIQLNDGLLLGIGMDDNRNLKVEVYQETETGVQSLCVYNTEIRSFASEYKAYYIDREKNFFGIPTQEGYLLLLFDGYQIVKLACAKSIEGSNFSRGVVIDHYLYAFDWEGFEVVKI